MISERPLDGAQVGSDFSAALKQWQQLADAQAPQAAAFLARLDGVAYRPQAVAQSGGPAQGLLIGADSSLAVAPPSPADPSGSQGPRSVLVFDQAGAQAGSISDPPLAVALSMLEPAGIGLEHPAAAEAVARLDALAAAHVIRFE